MPRLFHCTDEVAAREILRSGFRDETGAWGLTGVWLSPIPFQLIDAANRLAVLEVNIRLTTDQLFEHEVVEADKPYREFLLPAELVNTRSTIRLLTNDEAEAACTSEPWDEYPPGEPERTWKLIREEDKRLNEEIDGP